MAPVLGDRDRHLQMAFTSEINTWTCLDVLDTSFFSIRMVEYMHVYLTRVQALHGIYSGNSLRANRR